jgi:hypothetical protein
MLLLPIVLSSSISITSEFFFLYSLDSYSYLHAMEMNSELHRCAESGNLERVKQLVEGGANIEEFDDIGMSPGHGKSVRGIQDCGVLCGAWSERPCVRQH